MTSLLYPNDNDAVSIVSITYGDNHTEIWFKYGRWDNGGLNANVVQGRQLDWWIEFISYCGKPREEEIYIDWNSNYKERGSLGNLMMCGCGGLLNLMGGGGVNNFRLSCHRNILMVQPLPQSYTQ